MRAELKQELTALKHEDTSVERRSLIDHALALVDLPTRIDVNTEGIEEVRSQAQQHVNEQKDKLDELQWSIEHEYDTFLDSLQTTLVSNDSSSISLSTNLLGADKRVIETMKNESHPEQSYLELNKKVMEGFANSLETHSPEDLNMSLLTYNETKNYIGKTLDAVNEGLGIYEGSARSNGAMNNETRDDNTSAPLLAANATPMNHSMTETSHSHALASPTAESQTDLSQYINGVFVKNASGDLVNVVNREDIIDTLKENQQRADLNNDGLDDIILWTEKHIRVKYSHPEKTAPTIAFTRLYRTSSFKTPADLAKATKNGRYSSAGSTFKIWDTYTAVQ